MKNWLVFLLTGALLLSNCQSDREAGPETRAKLLVRVWEIQSAQMLVGTTPIPVYTRGDAKSPLDMSKFSLDFRNDSQVIQTSTAGTAEAYNWKLLNNDTQWSITDGLSPSVWDIEQLTKENFDYSRQIAGNSTDEGDRAWLRMIQSVGLATSQGVKLSRKMTPKP